MEAEGLVRVVADTETVVVEVLEVATIHPIASKRIVGNTRSHPMANLIRRVSMSKGLCSDRTAGVCIPFATHEVPND